MRDFTLERSQVIDRPIEGVFAFFGDARNLAFITPDWLRFRIATPTPIEMAEGVFIDYVVKLRGIPMRWRSEITVWEPPFRFVDEQRRGPYRYWIHEHAFDAVSETQTRIEDRVRYSVPGGALAHRLFVEPDLARIFAYRSQKLDEIFHQQGELTTWPMAKSL
jgi:ligand-binding SRPBCC domain-containing protein